MKQNKKKKIKGCACYGVNSIHPCFCSPFSNKDKKPLKQAVVISKRQRPDRVTYNGIKLKAVC